MDTEDKSLWCERANDDELAFSVQRLFNLKIAGFINLNKLEDKYTHDLYIQLQADLKSVRTPLFKSMELYGIDPQYAVTFNLKDGQRYRKLYPNIVVLFDVKWDLTEKEIGGWLYKVNPMHETYAGFLDDIVRAIKKSGNKKIEYQRRANDTAGNAKASWVFDVRGLQKIS
jgi:hypothetical protein